MPTAYSTRNIPVTPFSNRKWPQVKSYNLTWYFGGLLSNIKDQNWNQIVINWPAFFASTPYFLRFKP